MEYFESEVDFWKAYEQLCAITNVPGEWTSPRARIDHADMFDDFIPRSEVYFMKQSPKSRDAVVKLSLRSMEKILFAIVATSPNVGKLGDLILEIESEAREKSMKGFSV